MQIYWNKIKRLHKKGVWLPADWFGTPTWPLFHCFNTNMAAVTSCKNTLYHSEENGKGFFKSFFAKPASQLWSLFFIILFCYFCGFMNSLLASYIDLLYFVSVAHMPLINRQWGHYKEISDRDLLDLLAERSTPRPEISFNDRTDKFNKLFIIRPF